MNTDSHSYTVGEVARIAGLTVRTLHHYDQCGLLHPSRRTGAGYRLYTSADLERLQQVLLHKELGFGLEQIRALMADPDYDHREALRAQRRQVEDRVVRLEAMLRLIDKTLASLDGDVHMSDEERFEVFGDFDPAAYEAEARERWGEQTAYHESARRTRDYSKKDWTRLKAEADVIHAKIATLMDEGTRPDDARAMDAAERHRRQIDHWFYPCSPAIHVELGRMYVADARFAATYETIRPGMAQYLCDAIVANSARVQKT